MAKRNCREENGEIRFDYDMAIAEPFRTAGAGAAGRSLAIVPGARRKSHCSSSAAQKSDLLTAETAAEDADRGARR